VGRYRSGKLCLSQAECGIETAASQAEGARPVLPGELEAATGARGVCPELGTSPGLGLGPPAALSLSRLGLGCSLVLWL